MSHLMLSQGNLHMANRYERVKAFRETVKLEKNYIPGLKISVEYVDDTNWEDGDPVNYDTLSAYIDRRQVKLTAETYGLESYNLLVKIQKNTHQDQHSRRVLSIELCDELNVLIHRIQH